jgi:hypothetical protein
MPYAAKLNAVSKTIPTAIRPSGCLSQSKSLLIIDAPEIKLKRNAAGQGRRRLD